MNTTKSWFVLAVLAAAAWSICNPTLAVAISSPGGGFQVGLVNTGEMCDTSIGFLRTADGYDPIIPGTPRDSWGVSAGTIDGWANHADYGVVNITTNTAIFAANSASISTFLTAPAGGNLLQVDQNYTFAAENVIKIATTVKNISGTSQEVKFARNVDWDIWPNEYSEYSKVDAFSAPISAASYWGFEHPSPLVAFTVPAPAAGGTSGPSDLGGGFQLDLGTLNPDQTISFYVFYGLNSEALSGSTGQSEAELRAELYSLGASFVITGNSSENGGPGLGTNSVALGYGVPEPSTITLLIGTILGIGGFKLIRRKKNK